MAFGQNPNSTVVGNHNFKKYVGTKEVMAMRIVDRRYNIGTTMTYLYDDKKNAFEVTDEWMAKHAPKIGGYVVIYEDGYQSYSPPEAFEKAYMLTSDVFGMDEVIRGLKKGKSYSRHGWNGKDLFIKGQFPDEHSKMTAPYTYIDTRVVKSEAVKPVRALVPWIMSQTDQYAEDWFEVV
jgi:hypothetical protein